MQLMHFLMQILLFLMGQFVTLFNSFVYSVIIMAYLRINNLKEPHI